MDSEEVGLEKTELEEAEVEESKLEETELEETKLEETEPEETELEETELDEAGPVVVGVVTVAFTDPHWYSVVYVALAVVLVVKRTTGPGCSPSMVLTERRSHPLQSTMLVVVKTVA